MSNKKTGNDFEDEFCKLASGKGFWAHRITGNKYGQPADVIIVKDGKAALIDCKDCETNIFKLSRIEENQELAMDRWIKRGNKFASFALKVCSEVYIIPYEKLIQMRDAGAKQLNYTQILEHGNSFDEWVVFFDADNSQ